MLRQLNNQGYPINVIAIACAYQAGYAAFKENDSKIARLIDSQFHCIPDVNDVAELALAAGRGIVLIVCFQRNHITISMRFR